MFKRLVATSRAPQIMVSSMLRSFGKIGPQIDQIWAWLSRGHRWSPGVRNPFKSSVMGPSLLVNCYLEIKFYKIIRVNPRPPPPPPPLNGNIALLIVHKDGILHLLLTVSAIDQGFMGRKIKKSISKERSATSSDEGLD